MDIKDTIVPGSLEYVMPKDTIMAAVDKIIAQHSEIIELNKVIVRGLTTAVYIADTNEEGAADGTTK